MNHEGAASKGWRSSKVISVPASIRLERWCWLTIRMSFVEWLGRSLTFLSYVPIVTKESIFDIQQNARAEYSRRKKSIGESDAESTSESLLQPLVRGLAPKHRDLCC